MRGQSYLYAAAFNPGFIKVGRSQAPSVRVQQLQYSSILRPADVDFDSIQIVGMVPESGNLTEAEAHKRLSRHLHKGCREWFADNRSVRAELRNMGFCKANVQLADKYLKTTFSIRLDESLQFAFKTYAIASRKTLEQAFAEAIYKTLPLTYRKGVEKP